MGPQTAQSQTPPISAERLRLLDAAITAWKNQLVDLTARNNLLYFRDLRAGTLDFSGRSDAVDRLLGGGELSLARVFSSQTPRVAFAKRARTIRNKAKELFEERGLETMFLAHGLATWAEEGKERTRPPAAPVALVPVSLEPTAPGSGDFALRLAGEPRINPALLRKLGADFGVPVVAEEFDLELIDATSVQQLERGFSRLRELAHTVTGFDIDGRTVLGTFSYAKLPMVLDLDRARDELAAHELVAALCGDEDARRTLRERNATGEPIALDEPDRTAPSAEHLVLDADASQSHAINTVLASRDLIVQGPPGTGKSQTIANLIAALVADGRTVLFVAEKRAAIDAVFKRLRGVGLGELLLDMHDGQKQRAPFAQELMSAVRSHRRHGEPALEDEQRRLVRARGDLNTRDGAQHGVRDPFGTSVYDARVRREGLPAMARSDTRYRGEQLLALTHQAMSEARGLMRQWFALGADVLYGSGDPWSHATVADTEASAQALAVVRRAADALAESAPPRADTSEQAGLPAPETPQEWDRQLMLQEAIVDSAQWFTPALLADDLELLVERLRPLAAGAFARAGHQVMSGDYRQAKQTVRAGSTDAGRTLDRRVLVEALEAARDRQRQWRALAGEQSAPRLAPSLELTRAAQQRVAACLEEVRGIAPTLELAGHPFEKLEPLLVRMASDTVAAATMAEVNPLEQRLRALGLAAVLEEVRAERLGLDGALARMDYVWLTSVIEHFELTDRWVSAVKGPQHTVDEFQQLDRHHIAAGPARVLRACATASVAARDAHPEQALLVERQANLKPRSPRHLPIREFFAQAPDVLRALKPCWAMSPLVVSQTLPAQRDLFDVVIFDEASQVTPADAIPAILRGRRLLVAGDSRQLPPTAFFAQAIEEEEDPELPVDAGTVGYESILDSLGGLLPERMLTWHYRSRDERLIAFSNTHIYDRALTTFPGVRVDEVIRHEHVPWEPGRDESDESSSAEVDRVVDLIVNHVLTRPDETLGVIAMGLKHAQAIADELRRRRDAWREESSDTPASASDRKGQLEPVDDGRGAGDDGPDGDDDALDAGELTARLDAFVDERRDEAFFIKNLERVQGDERDAIILTVGYGKEPATGRMLYRFGPLLQDGGERRLNVAVTRAKLRMTVVSSFTADDLDPGKLNKEGAKLLRSYLAYAASEGRELGDADAPARELNPFEIAVRDALVQAGIPLIAQFGVGGYRIDFAAHDPDDPRRCVLAIECDGASYHSSPIARERDRLRQEHLERLGWRFCRIWSSDWFNAREKEIARALATYQRAVAGGEEDRRPDPFEPTGEPPPARAEPRAREPEPRVADRYDPREIVAILAWIESDTLPRTRNELFAAALAALGFERPGPKIKPAIETAIAIHRGELDADAASVPASRARPGRAGRVAEPPTARASGGAAGNHLIGEHAAVRIRYAAKSGSGTSERVVNPLVIRGNLLWAWCHKIDDVRCFNTQRVTSWWPVNEQAWPAPEGAQAAGEAAARSFAPTYQPRGRRGRGYR